MIREEADHSVMSMAGLGEDEDMFAGVLTSARRRAVWLSVNLATAFLAANVVGLFEATIEKVVALAVLMPIVASMGGIAGSQTLVLIIRGIAVGQVEQANARWLLIREICGGPAQRHRPGQHGRASPRASGSRNGPSGRHHLRRADDQSVRGGAGGCRRAADARNVWASIPRWRAA